MTFPYQVLGPTIPVMLGRRQLLSKIESHLLKPTPDHISVVGPTLYGKSVFLYHLAEKHRSKSQRFLAAAYFDFRHSPPSNDSDFRAHFAESVKTALVTVRPKIAECIVLGDASVHELLELALEELENENKCLLVVLDGFDHVLAGTGLTRNLWDQLRSLAQKTSIRFVTGSRRPLRELCKTEESRTSDFWEIFYDTPIPVGPFEEADWEDILGPFAQARISLDSSARKEVVNWTGGVPVLVGALLQTLASDVPEGAVLSKENIDSASHAVLEERRVLLTALWEDSDLVLRSDIAILADHQTEGVPTSDLSDARRRALEERGFAHISGNRLRSACRLMAQYAAQQAPAVADLKRLFGGEDGFTANIRGLLELRFGQVANRKIDAALVKYVENAIRDLGPSPEDALKWMRSITGRALSMIWQAELDTDENLPDDWIEEWRRAGDDLQWLQGNRRLPRGGQGIQCRVLRLATGAERIRPLAKFATKPTALLVDALVSVGNFAEHQDDFRGSEVSIGFASAVVLTAIQLLASLSRDLERPGISLPSP